MKCDIVWCWWWVSWELPQATSSHLFNADFCPQMAGQSKPWYLPGWYNNHINTPADGPLTSLIGRQCRQQTVTWPITWPVDDADNYAVDGVAGRSGHAHRLARRGAAPVRDIHLKALSPGSLTNCGLVTCVLVWDNLWHSPVLVIAPPPATPTNTFRKTWNIFQFLIKYFPPAASSLLGREPKDESHQNKGELWRFISPDTEFYRFLFSDKTSMIARKVK